MKTNILFPVETTARELDSRIVLGVKVADSNKIVTIADQQLVRSLTHFIKGGVFFGKHLFGKPKFSDDKHYRRLKTRGIKVVYLSEEGGIWPGQEEFWSKTLIRQEKPSLFDESDIYCTWGDWQLDFAKKNYDLKCTSLVTGTPRFSILTPKYSELYNYDADLLREKFGKFILFNTSFSAANGINREEGWFNDLHGYSPDDSESRSRWFGKYSQQLIAVATIVELVNRISVDCPEYQLVIRPHPSENMQYYRNVFRHIENVHVEYEGSAIEWIIASKLLIQSGCTTGLEAVLLNKKVINLSVSDDSVANVHIPEQCGLKTADMDTIIDTIKNNFQHPDLVKRPSDETSFKLVQNLSNENSLDILAKEIEKAARTVDLSSKVIIPGYIFSVFHAIYLCLKFMYFACTRRKYRILDYTRRFTLFKKEAVIRKIHLASKIEGKTIEILKVTPFSISFTVKN